MTDPSTRPAHTMTHPPRQVILNQANPRRPNLRFPVQQQSHFGRWILWRGILALCLGLLLTPAQAEVVQVNNSELKTLLAQGVPLIDVRRPDEWKQTGIVDGSHLLTFFDAKGNYDVKKWLADLDKIAPDDQSFILICAVGGRTGNISKLLDRKLGYTGVHNLTKGIRGWIMAGEPTTPWTP